VWIYEECFESNFEIGEGSPRMSELAVPFQGGALEAGWKYSFQDMARIILVKTAIPGKILHEGHSIVTDAEHRQFTLEHMSRCVWHDLLKMRQRKVTLVAAQSGWVAVGE